MGIDPSVIWWNIELIRRRRRRSKGQGFFPHPLLCLEIRERVSGEKGSPSFLLAVKMSSGYFNRGSGGAANRSNSERNNSGIRIRIRFMVSDPVTRNWFMVSAKKKKTNILRVLKFISIIVSITILNSKCICLINYFFFFRILSIA